MFTRAHDHVPCLQSSGVLIPLTWKTQMVSRGIQSAHRTLADGLCTMRYLCLVDSVQGNDIPPLQDAGAQNSTCPLERSALCRSDAVQRLEKGASQQLGSLR